MTTEKGQSFFSRTIDIDNKSFVSCKFSNCTLRYKGGQVEWDKDTSFVSCRWEFLDAAKRTIDVMNMIGADVSKFTLSGFAFRSL